MRSRRQKSPRRARRSHRFTTFLALSLVSVSLGSGCGADDEAELAQEGDVIPRKLVEMSRELDPPLSVQRDDVLGSSLHDVLHAATDGAELSVGHNGTTCAIDHYEVDGLTVATDERCPGYYRRAMVFLGAEHVPTSAAFVYVDNDEDDAIDGWIDPARGLGLEDLDYDHRPDRQRVSGDQVEPELIQTFAPGWIAPAVIEEHILEDTNFDGLYDRETLVAGVLPDGTPTYWLESTEP